MHHRLTTHYQTTRSTRASCSTGWRQYGQNLLQRYADDIGCNYETLKRCRSTYVAWETQIGPHGPPLPFAACRALVAVPNRVALLAADPQMTERAALAHARAYREAGEREPPCPLHKLHALLRQPQLLQLMDETIKHRDEEHGLLRLQAVQHITFVIDRLRAVVTALMHEEQPAAVAQITVAAAAHDESKDERPAAVADIGGTPAAQPPPGDPPNPRPRAAESKRKHK
jgi:hypothetical protein